MLIPVPLFQSFSFENRSAYHELRKWMKYFHQFPCFHISFCLNLFIPVKEQSLVTDGLWQVLSILMCQRLWPYFSTNFVVISVFPNTDTLTAGSLCGNNADEVGIRQSVLVTWKLSMAQFGIRQQQWHSSTYDLWLDKRIWIQGRGLER
jgi:hypothetical protein